MEEVTVTKSLDDSREVEWKVVPSSCWTVGAWAALGWMAGCWAVRVMGS